MTKNDEKKQTSTATTGAIWPLRDDGSPNFINVEDAVQFARRYHDSQIVYDLLALHGEKYLRSMLKEYAQGYPDMAYGEQLSYNLQMVRAAQTEWEKLEDAETNRKQIK